MKLGRLRQAIVALLRRRPRRADTPHQTGMKGAKLRNLAKRRTWRHLEISFDIWQLDTPFEIEFCWVTEACDHQCAAVLRRDNEFAAVELIYLLARAVGH